MTATFPTQSIGDWIFDLDNTIYPAKTNLFRRVSVRITEFVAAHYNVADDDARVIQKDLFHRYGTTMRGMMSEENIQPKVYLDFVHKIDVSDLVHDQELDSMLTSLPGRKHIFTNGTVSHAENILSADKIFSACDTVPLVKICLRPGREVNIESSSWSWTRSLTSIL